VSKTVFKDAFNLLCDDVIGRGMSRTVYSCRLRPDIVIKVEPDAAHFQNVIEWETWQRVCGTPASRWFAECLFISPCGTVLVMERTRPAAPAEFPERVPVYLHDLKRNNFGMSTGKADKQWFVCHDYGVALLFEHGTVTKRLKKADWIDAA
jgi:hypothetical protein